jgi:two-component system, NarL family, nitrate/nitrite response regulator NarL
MAPMTHILSVSDNRLISDMLRTILNKETDIRMLGAVSTEAQAQRETGRFEVALIDAALPAGGALRLTKWFAKAVNAPRVIIVGISENELVLRYLEAGAAGCVRSADDVTELLQAIRLVARQELALPPSLIAMVAERVAELAEKCRTLGGQLDRSFNQRSLTRREREILRLMAEGYGNREIAKQLTIELGTTKNHVHNILNKLSVNSRKDAAACWSLAANQL